MHYRKSQGVILLLLITALMFSGCQRSTSFILPPESTENQLQNVATAGTEPTEGTTEVTAAPTEVTTVPVEETTAPTQETTAPTEPTQTQIVETTPAGMDSGSEAHIHSYEATTVSPTCTARGYTRYTCDCGNSYQDEYTDALGHDYKVTTVPPTSTQRGYDQHQCSRCGDTYLDHYTEKLGGSSQPAPGKHQHSYTDTVVAPTCTADGYTEHNCACGDQYRSDIQKALGHDYKVTVVPPTVESQGYNLHECTRCGDSYKDTYINKLPVSTEPPETEPPETKPPENAHPVYDISDHVVGSLEYQILAEINAYRAAEGLGELKLDKKLCALAAIRAYESSISFSHTRPNGTSCFSVFDDYNYNAGLAGENLVYCNASYSAAEIVTSWMNSTSHKNNILCSSFRKAGLGIYYANGRVYVANLFVG